MFPAREDLTICFAHAAYQMKATFDALNTGIRSFGCVSARTSIAGLVKRTSSSRRGMWHNGLIPARALALQFIQSISSGDGSMRESRVAGAGDPGWRPHAGVDAHAVAEHAMGLILALVRRLPEARDNQAREHWRGMIGDLAGREDELGGKTLAIIGLGRIGGRLARLAKAFDMTVIGFRRDVAAGAGDAGCGLRAGCAESAVAVGGFRRVDVSADAKGGEGDQRGNAWRDEEVGIFGQCGARRVCG